MISIVYGIPCISKIEAKNSKFILKSVSMMSSEPDNHYIQSILIFKREYWENKRLIAYNYTLNIWTE